MGTSLCLRFDPLNKSVEIKASPLRAPQIREVENAGAKRR
jgi:hypothetical protein